MNSVLRPTLIGALAFALNAYAQPVAQIPPRAFQSTGLLRAEIDPEDNASLHVYEAGSLRSVELPEGLNRTFSSSHATALPKTGMVTSPENPEAGLATGAAPLASGIEQGGGSARQEIFILGGDAKPIESRKGNIITTLQRNADGMLTRLSLPSGHRFDLAYDPAGNLATVQDATLGGTTTLTYDPVHNLPVEVAHPNNGGSFRFEYDAAGNPITQVSAEGRRRTATWTSASQIESLTDEFNKKTSFIYGAAGNLESLREGEAAAQRVVSLERDPAGRVTRVTAPEGRTFSYAYHPSGALRAFINSEGNATEFEVDDNGDLAALVRPQAARHAWTYDGLRRVSSYTQPGRPTIQYAYNVHSEPTAMRVEGQDVAELAYNDRGQILSSRETALGLAPFTVTNRYNDTRTGQLTQADSSDGIRMVPTYRGEFTQRLTWSGGVVGSYDVEIDQRHRVTSAQIGSNPRVAYTYDRDNLLLSVGDLKVSRDLRSGLVTGLMLGAVTEQFEYNGFGELISQTAQVNGTAFYSARLVRDKLGRIIEMNETIRGLSSVLAYTYDASGRIATVRRDGTMTESYTYDARGNLISDLLNGAYAYNEADQLVSAGDSSYTYTATGERLTSTRAGANQNYRYTALGKLRAIDLGAGRSISYQHDPAGNRAARSLNGTRQQAWLCPDDNRPVAALDAIGQIAARYIYGLSEATPDFIIQASATYRLITDPLGNVRFAVNAGTGTIAQERSYDVYGRILNDTAPGFQPFGFAGGWTDPDTGLVRFGARDYDPEVRRWTTPDPIEFASGSPNHYAYVRGDPVNLMDPSGLNDQITDMRNQIIKTIQSTVKTGLSNVPGSPPQKVGKIVGIEGGTSITRTRNGESSLVGVESDVNLGDSFTTSQNTTTAIELSMGGRIGVPNGATVQLVNEGQGMRVNPSNGELTPIVLNSGGASAKFQKQDKPLTIGGRGSLTGIKG